MNKKCFRCKLEKPLEDFGLLKRSADGRRQDCKSCRKTLYYSNREKFLDDKRKDYCKHKESRLAKSKELYKENPNFYINKSKDYYNKNKTNRLEKAKIYRAKNADAIKQSKREYYQRPEVKERALIKSKEWKKNNPEKRREMDKRYLNKNPVRKVIKNMRTRIYCALKRCDGSRANHTIDILGCAPKFLKEHLESKFYDYIDDAGQVTKMSWDNLGNGPGTWQVDHIIALCLFDLSKPEDQLIANHWTNLQPLWFNDHNIKNQSDLLIRDEFRRGGEIISFIE